MNRILIILIVFVGSSLAQEGKLVPDAKLKDFEGKKFVVSEFYKEGPLLINFWNLACEPCKKEMKYLDIFNKKYKGNKFKVLSVNLDNSRSISKVKSYIKSQKFSFKVLSDPRMKFFKKSGGRIMPYVLLVDEKGIVIKKHTSYNPGDEVQLEKEIREILAISDSTTVVTPQSNK